MKKGIVSRVIALALVCSLTLSLAACGKKKNDNAGGNTQAVNVEELKNCVYKCEDVKLDVKYDDMSIQFSDCDDENIYILALLTDNENYEDNNYNLITMKKDGSNAETIKLTMPEGVTVSGGMDVFAKNAAVDTLVDEPAEETEAENTDEEASENEEVDKIASDGIATDDLMIEDDYFESSVYFGQFLMSGDFIYGEKIDEKDDYDNLDEYGNPTFTTKISVMKWNKQGELLGDFLIDFPEDEYFYVLKMLKCENGGVDLIISGNSNYICEMSEDGQFGERSVINDTNGVLDSYSDIIQLKDGKCLITYYNNDWTELKTIEFDISANAFAEGKVLPEFISKSYYSLIPGLSHDLLYSTSNGLYGFNLGDADCTQIMDFVASDIIINGMYGVLGVDENTFIASYYDYNYDTAIGLFTKVDPASVVPKQTLCFGVSYIDSETKKKIVDFNKSNEKYRIIVKCYEDYLSGDDYSEITTLINNDIISGNMPDILMVSDSLPLNSYISKGLICDIGAMIEKDEELSKVAYLDNVFDAFSVNGKLYSVVPSFILRTMVAKDKVYAANPDWTMKDFLEITGNLPSGSVGIADVTREYFLRLLMLYNGSSYVDVSKGKCNFDTEDFISALKYAETLPVEFSEDYYNDEAYWANYESQYIDDRTLLMDTSIYSIQDMTYNLNGYFGGEGVIVGFPSEFENKSVISPCAQYVISEKSSMKEAAWEFVREFITPSYQENLEWGLPVEVNAFEKGVSAASDKPFYIDDDGSKVEYEYTFYINDESVEINCLSKEQIEAIKKVITTADRLAYNDEAILNIIIEEAESFFNKQKSAEEVAGVIQNRVQLYVSENN